MLLTILSVVMAALGLVLAGVALVVCLTKSPQGRISDLSSRIRDLEEYSDRLDGKHKRLAMRLNSALWREGKEKTVPIDPDDNNPREDESREEWETRIRQKFIHGVK